MYEEIINKLKSEVRTKKPNLVQNKIVSSILKKDNKHSKNNLISLSDDDIISINDLNKIDSSVKKKLPEVVYIFNKKENEKPVEKPKKEIKRKFTLHKKPNIKLNSNNLILNKNLKKSENNVWL